jgi:hypothetical protein
MLIEYFFENPPEIIDLNETVPVEAVLKKKLHDILEVAIEGEVLSEEMKELLAEYIDIDETGSTRESEEEQQDSHDGNDEPELKPDFSSLTLDDIEMHNKTWLGKERAESHDTVESWLGEVTADHAQCIGGVDVNLGEQ